MKVNAKIIKIIPWEKRKKYEVISMIKNADGEYDFLVMKNIWPKPQNLRERLKILINGRERKIENMVIGLRKIYPVKRPHDYKVNEIIEIETEVRKIQP